MAEVLVVVESSITGSLPQVKIKFVLIGGDHHSSRVKTSNRGEEDEDQADWDATPAGDTSVCFAGPSCGARGTAGRDGELNCSEPLYLLHTNGVSEGSQPFAAASLLPRPDDKSKRGAALKFKKNIYQFEVLEEESCTRPLEQTY